MGFQQIEQARAHEYVAEQIRRQISLHLLPPGTSLPPERELASLFGVGRATIESAIRVLEAERLLETRRGRSGGRFVVTPAADGLAMDYLLVRLRRNKSDIGEILQFRSAVEPQITAAASTQSAESLIAAERAAADGAQAESDGAFMAADTEFHLAIARATSNSFFVSAVEQIRVVLSDALTVLPESKLWHDRTASEHEAILVACRASDPQGAAEAMQAHIGATERSIRALLARI